MGKRMVVLLGELINPRMEKRLHVEQNAANVHLICWDRDENMVDRPNEDGYTAHSIRIKAKNDPLRRLFPYYKFTKYAKSKLRELKPDIIHVQNLDMLKIAVWYKTQVDKCIHIIYEVGDLHKLIIDKQYGIRRLAQKYLRYEDRKCCKYIDLLIITSEKFYEKYFYSIVPNEKVLYMPNVPDLAAFKYYKHKKDEEKFVVGFIGAVRYKQQMRNLIEAGELADVNVLFAGVEYDSNEIETLCKNKDYIEWYGKFDFEKEAADLYGKCDVIYSVYNADMSNVKVALPNKLYESIYCEVPLIVAKGTYLADLVNEWGIGVAVDHKSVKELVDAIKLLKVDKVFYRTVVEHCKAKKGIIDLKKNNNNLISRITELF